MIYVFEDGSFVTDEKYLSVSDLKRTVAIEEFPKRDDKENMQAVLKASVDEQRVWWEYEPLPKPPPTVEELQANIELLEDALLDLADMIL